MARRLCPNCRHELEAETIGRNPGTVVGWCEACDLVVMPGDEIADVVEFPRSSEDSK